MTQGGWWEPTWMSLRVAMAIGIAAAITAQYINNLMMASRDGNNLATTSANFFSYFTVLSNLGTVIALLWAAVWWIAVGRRHDNRPEPRPLAVTLAGATVYLLATGIVYNALLRAIPEPPGAVVPWSNEILHVAAPTFMLLDLFLGPRRRCLAWGTVGGLLVFPIVWVVYTMIRGPLTVSSLTGTTPWYPYPFLYPDKNLAGFVGVLGYIVVIALLLAVIATVVVAVARRRASAAFGAPDAPAASSPSGERHPPQ